MRTNIERNNHNYCFLISCLAGISAAAIALSIISSTIIPIIIFVGLFAVASCFKSPTYNEHSQTNNFRSRLFYPSYHCTDSFSTYSLFGSTNHGHYSYVPTHHSHNNHASTHHSHNNHASTHHSHNNHASTHHGHNNHAPTHHGHW